MLVAMNNKIFRLLSGLQGVDAEERPVACQWATRFEIPMLLIALWIPIQWYLEVQNLLVEDFILLADWLVWLTFSAETVVLTLLVRDKRRYLTGNWMNLLIIIGGLPLLWPTTPLAGLLRSLRLLLLLSLFFRFSRTLRELLSHNSIGTTLSVAFVIILLAGLLMSAIEPSVDNPLDGIWWAWVTVTTVGYGDIVPTTPAGKLFGALLILLGLALISLMTASFSAFFVERGVVRVEKDIERDVNRVQKEEVDIMRRLDAIQQQLEVIQDRLEQLEKKSTGMPR